MASPSRVSKLVPVRPPGQTCYHVIQPVMAGQTEDVGQFTIVERKVILRRHKSQKYRCTFCVRKTPHPDRADRTIVITGIEPL